MRVFLSLKDAIVIRRLKRVYDWIVIEQLEDSLECSFFFRDHSRIHIIPAKKKSHEKNRVVHNYFVDLMLLYVESFFVSRKKSWKFIRNVLLSTIWTNWYFDIEILFSPSTTFNKCVSSSFHFFRLLSHFVVFSKNIRTLSLICFLRFKKKMNWHL